MTLQGNKYTHCKLLLLGVICFFLTIDILQSSSPAVQASSNPTKMLFMYIGKTPGGTPYKTFTVQDFNQMTNVEEFVILPTCDPRAYGMGPYTEIYQGMMSLIQTIRNSTRREAGVWIATPGFDTKDSPFKILYPLMHNFLKTVSTTIINQLGEEYWKTHVRGIYFNIESVYGSFENGKIMENPVVSLANKMSKLIHGSLQKQFLWIPYMKLISSNSTESDIPLRIANVVNTGIFDKILLQPMWYFSGLYNEEGEVNLDWVYWSIKNNAISDQTGALIANRTNYFSELGIQMEVDGNAGNPKGIYRKRFDTYVAKFKEFTTTTQQVPFSFYAGSCPDVMAVLDLIQAFYNF